VVCVCVCGVCVCAMHILHGRKCECKLVATPDNLDPQKFFMSSFQTSLCPTAG
jgi:uncharacterized protein YebE (UPF0316 family)